MKITDIYDFFARNRGIRRVSLLVLTVLFAVLLTKLDFSEDISDFLPLGTREREQMSIYQNISGADKLLILFSNPGDPDQTLDAVDRFVMGNDELTGTADMDIQLHAIGACPGSKVKSFKRILGRVAGSAAVAVDQGAHTGSSPSSRHTAAAIPPSWEMERWRRFPPTRSFRLPDRQ